MNPSFLRHITPIVLTFNESPNIARALSKLASFSEVLVVDSGSTDETLALIAEYPNVRVLSRPFDSFSGQWNFALRNGGVATEWVLAMDADYILTDDGLAELAALLPGDSTVAYRVPFTYCIFGNALRSTLYPPLIALYRHRGVHYVQDGHCMRAQVSGAVGDLQVRVRHDDRKPLSRWLSSQASYAEQESALLLSKPWRQLRLQDRLRRLIVITPWLVPLYCLTVGRGALDGWPGLYYALQRGVAEAVLSLRLIEARIARQG